MGFKKKLKLQYATLVSTIFTTFDSICTSTVYTCYINPSLTSVYNNTLKFAVLPMLALDSTMCAIAAWYFAHIERNEDGSLKTGKVVYASVTTAAAVMMVLAAVTGIVFQVKFAILSPIFFSLNMAINSFYNLGAAIYYWGKSVGTPEPDPNIIVPPGEEPPINKKKLYRNRAIGHAIAGTLGSLIAATALVVIPLGKTIYAPIGTALGIIGGVLSSISMIRTGYKIYKMHKEHKASKQDTSWPRAEVAPTCTLGIQQRLEEQPRLSPTNDETYDTNYDADSEDNGRHRPRRAQSRHGHRHHRYFRSASHVTDSDSDSDSDIVRDSNPLIEGLTAR